MPGIRWSRASMGNSGIAWVDAIFDWAVYLLADAAKLLGISYEEVNILIFLVLWPLLTIAMLVWTIVLSIKCRNFKRAEIVGNAFFGRRPDETAN
jgi:hypothetical protein